MNLYGAKIGIKRSFVYALGGSGASQALLLLSAPILTRLYTPKDFGLLAVYIAIVTFLSTIVFFRYELAITLSRSVTTTLAIIKLCLILGSIVSIIIWGGLYSLNDNIFMLLSGSDYKLSLWLIPVAACALSLMSLCRFWIVKAGRFDIMAVSRGSVTLILITVQLVGGLLKVGAIGLIVGHLIANLLTASALFGLVFKKYICALRSIRPCNVKKVAVRYINFPKYIVISDGLLTLGIQAPPIVIASVFSVSSAGLFALAYRCALAPVSLVAESCGKVFLSRSLALKADERLPKFVMMSYLVLNRIAIIPLLLIGLISDNIVILIFGLDWSESGLYITLLIPSIAAIFIFVPVMTLFTALERQKMELRFQTLILTFRMIGLSTGVAMGDIYSTILLYSLFTCFGFVVTGCWIMMQSGVSLISIFRTSVVELVFSVALVLPAFYLVIYGDLITDLLGAWCSVSYVAIFAIILGTTFYRIKNSVDLLAEYDIISTPILRI
jgi:O-antigen/teichoic acid export membrane protein